MRKRRQAARTRRRASAARWRALSRAGAWFSRPRVGLPLLSVAVLGFAAWWTYYGRLHTDEGFYLYCGKLAWQGKTPYHDFLWTQLPLVLYLYGAVSRFISGSLWAGRVLSLVLTGAVAWMTVVFARRSYGMRGALMAGLLLGTNSYALYHLVISKGYASGALLLLGGLYLASRRPRRWWEAVLAGVLLGGASLMRASAGVALVVVVLWEMLGRRRFAMGMLALLGGLVTVAAGTLPFALVDWRAMWFGVWKFHQVGWVTRTVGLAAGESGTRFVPVLLVMGGVVLCGLAGGRRRVRDLFWRSPTGRLLLLTVVPLAVVHTVAGARVTEYHVLYFPVVCVLVGGWAALAWREARGVGWRTVQVAAIAVALFVGLFGTWPEGSWLSGGRNVYPELPGSMVRAVRENTRPGDRILALQSEVFLATGRDGVPGTEMGPFGMLYDYSRDGWRPPGSFTEEQYLEILRTGAVPVVVLWQYDLAMLYNASVFRNRRTDYRERFKAAIMHGYRYLMSTDEMEGGRPRQVYDVWVRK